jgi:hypothetical protein
LEIYGVVYSNDRLVVSLGRFVFVWCWLGFRWKLIVGCILSTIDAGIICYSRFSRVYTLFFGTWAFILGWVFDRHEFVLEAWKSCIFWAAIPVGLLSLYFARSVREIGLDRLRGE